MPVKLAPSGNTPARRHALRVLYISLQFFILLALPIAPGFAPGLALAAANNVLTWSGANGNTWNTADQNWVLAYPTTPAAFQNGDIVTFSGNGSGTVNINAGDVSAASIYVWGGNDYIFSGGNLAANNAAGATSFNPASDTAALGQLFLGGSSLGSNVWGQAGFQGTLDLTGTTLNNFLNGITFYSGTLLVNNENQLGTGLSKVAFTSSATNTRLNALKTAISTGGDVRAAMETARSTGFQSILRINASKTAVFDGASGAGQRLAVGNYLAGGIDLFSGANLTWKNGLISGSTPNGGALSVGSGSVFTLTAQDKTGFLFQKNHASSSGAIDNDGYLSVQGAQFDTNSAANYGGAIAVGNSAYLNVSDSSFTGNQAKFGGGIYMSGGAAIFTDTTFSGNASTLSGGALLNAGGTATITGGSFSGNTSGAAGGAMVNAGTATITNTSFTGNKSASNGGAIYSSGATLNLNAQAGQNMAFSGNMANTSIANSIYLAANSVNNSLNIDTDTGAVLDMLDPMGGTSSNSHSSNISKTGAGALKLGGESIFTLGTNGLGTSFNVGGGTLHLYRAGEAVNGNSDVTAGMLNLGKGANSIFTLASGATLDLGGGNALTASQVNLNSGSTLGFDIGNMDQATTALTIDAATQNLSSDSALNFGINLDSWHAGDYVLIDSQANGKFGGLDLSAIANAVTINGQSVGDVIGHRADVDVTTGNNDSQLILQATTNNNQVLAWTGADGNSWSTGAMNWDIDGTTNQETFLGGDVANFDGTDTAGNREIVVSGGAAVAQMRVSGGATYTFSGSAITSATSTTDNIHLAGLFTEDLQVSGFGTEAVFKNTLDFAKGLAVVTGATVTLEDGGSFSDRMTVTTDNTGVVNFNHTTDYTQAGDLTGTGIYAKNGSGSLTLSGLNNTGTFDQNAGDVYMTSDWGGQYNQMSTAGVFRAASGVEIRDATFGGVVDISLPGAPAQLTINNNLTLNGATLNVDLFNGDTSDTIRVLNGSLTASGSNSIDITTWAEGSFNIITTNSGITNTGTFSATLNGHTLGLRSSALVDAATNNLILTTSVNNLDLTWNGASGPWNYAAANDNWLDPLSADDSFHPNDAVTFGGAVGSANTVVVDSGGVQVSQMAVNSGRYTFQGGDILGVPVNKPGFVRDGSLLISGPGAAALFNNNISFLQGGIGVENGALLGGNGRIAGNVRVASGGIISPGSSIGTLTVNGDVDFDSSTYFDVEVDPASGRGDLLQVQGTARLGGAMVRHIGLGGQSDYSPLGRWTILSAANLDGTFNPAVDSNFHFLDLSLLYENSDVILEIARNAASFGAFAETRNQRAVARGLGSLSGGTLINAVLAMPADGDVAGLYDQLSGEMHASLSGALMNYDRGFASSLRGRIMERDERQDGYPLWITLEGGRSRTDSTGGTSEAKLETYGFSMGAEKRFSQDFKAGLALRYADNDLKVDNLRSEAEVQSLSLGLYAGWDLLRNGDDSLRLSFGGTYGHHSVDSTRHIRSETLRQSLDADYDVQTAQVFTELGYRFDFGEVKVEPHAGLAWNTAWSESFRESGGSAALRAESESNDNVSSTAGLRATVNPTERLAIKADLAWEHVYGDRDPESTFAFSGGQSFTIYGAPLSRDAANMELAASFNATENIAIEAGYDGVYGDRHQSHGGHLSFKFNF